MNERRYSDSEPSREMGLVDGCFAAVTKLFFMLWGSMIVVAIVGGLVTGILRSIPLPENVQTPSTPQSDLVASSNPAGNAKQGMQGGSEPASNKGGWFSGNRSQKGASQTSDATDVNQQIIEQLKRQNELLEKQINDKKQEDEWRAERERYFQRWAESSAKLKEALDKSRFESMERQELMRSSADALRGNISMPRVRTWVPTYGSWYSRYLEEFRKVCGTMSRDELREFAMRNGYAFD